MTPAEIDKVLKTLKKEDIAGIECKHVCYSRSRYGEPTDMLTIKEIIHTRDGRKFPRLRFVQDYKRPFWLVNKPYRNYKDRKEWEYVNRCMKFETTQIKLCESIVRAQGYGNPKSSLKMLARNQFLFGADISTPALMKAAYQKRCPDLFTPNTVAVIDSETDVVTGDGSNPILLTITFKDKVFTTISKKWIEGIADPIPKIMDLMNKHLKDDIEARKIKAEFVISDSEADMCYQVIQKAHEWQPDFITFWNMDYDMTVIINVLEKAQYDLAEVFSDPRVPTEFKYFNYRRGPSIKEKADGTVENLASYDRWHVVDCPASWVAIDAMCVYRQIRRAHGKAPSYSLDYTLETNLERNKLYFPIDERGAPGSIEWHINMQRFHKLEYTVYNIFDCIGVELLDEKTKDLQTQISILSGYSEYGIFNSNPKRTMDALHFFCLERGKVAGCVNDKMVEDLDKELPQLDGWIVTLPTHLVVNNGLPLLEELPDVQSTVRMYVSDADITSTYPNGEIIMNLSKETTMMEMGRISGLLNTDRINVGINLTGGPVNAIEIMTHVMHAPRPDQLLDAFMEELQKEVA